MKDGESREQTEIAVFSLLQAGLGQLELHLPENAANRLTRLVMLLDSWAGKINLTGHRDPIDMAGRLVLDAAAMAAQLPELRGDSDSLADLGTGAGFPGLPFAILHPDLEVYLVDSRLKRNHFQREARRHLGLARVHPILGRSEEVERQACDVVVAQAMAQPERALALMTQWARPGALLVLPASEAAGPPHPPEHVTEPSLIEYQVPETHVNRRLWISRFEPM